MIRLKAEANDDAACRRTDKRVVAELFALMHVAYVYLNHRGLDSLDGIM